MAFANAEEQRAYQREWIASRKAAWSKDKHCVKCGSHDQLEIHHIDPEQKINHRVWSWSQERRDAELAKCEVLCTDCHAVETLLQSIVIEHGTKNMYMTHGCRCSPCVSAASVAREAQRTISGRKHQPSYRPRSSVGRAVDL